MTDTVPTMAIDKAAAAIIGPELAGKRMELLKEDVPGLEVRPSLQLRATEIIE